MGHWNHRVVKHTSSWIDKEGNSKSEEYYTVEEVYYENDGTVRNFTENLSLISDSVEGLKWTLEKMLKCLENPTINGDLYK